MLARLNANKHHPQDSGTLCVRVVIGIDASQFCPILLRSPASTVPSALKSPSCQAFGWPNQFWPSAFKSDTLMARWSPLDCSREGHRGGDGCNSAVSRNSGISRYLQTSDDEIEEVHRLMVLRCERLCCRRVCEHRCERTTF